MLKNAIMIAGLSTILYGCNTMEGLGTDIKHAGQSLEESAEKNKNPDYSCGSAACPLKIEGK